MHVKIDNLRGLEQFGVNLLTGEACAYGMRLLCDMNERGAELVRTFLGLSRAVTFESNWNSQVNGEPAIASVMLTRDTLWELARFALFQAGADYAIRYNDGTLLGLDRSSRYCENYLKLAADNPAVTVFYNNARLSNQPHVGDRNVHAFTGRTA